MDENDLPQVRAIYKSILELVKNIDPKSGYSINNLLVANYDLQVGELSRITGIDYSRYLSNGRIEYSDSSGYYARDFVYLLSQLLGEIEGRFDFGSEKSASPLSVITIDNSNRNQISIAFKNISQIIGEVEDPEVITKLAELNSLLSDRKKDVSRIRQILVWLSDKSWDIFLAVLPYLLDKLGTKV